MVRAEGLHEFILNHIDILELVDHYVFKALLPLLTDFVVCLKNVEHELEKVVVVKAEALFFLIEITVKNNVIWLGGSKVLLMDFVERHADKVFVIMRLFKKLFDFYHVASCRKSHLSKCKATLFVNNLQHCVYVGIVQNKKTFWIAYSMGIFLKHAYTKAVERRNVTCVVVACELTDSVSHFGSGFVCKSNAKYVRRKNANFVYKICKAVGEGAGFS